MCVSRTNETLTGPCIAGIVVTFASWRIILWIQAGMIAVGFILSVLSIPRSRLDAGMLKSGHSLQELMLQFNPLPVFKLMVYPNIFLTVRLFEV